LLVGRRSQKHETSSGQPKSAIHRFLSWIISVLLLYL